MADPKPWFGLNDRPSLLLSFPAALSSPWTRKFIVVYLILAVNYIFYQYFWRRRKATNMARSPFVVFNAFLLALVTVVHSVPAPTPVATTSSFRSIFTVPSAADNGQNVLPNIKDPAAVNAQTVCPGYSASGVSTSSNGLTAQLSLAGKACNTYGTDVDSLKLTVEYQANDRLHVEITPTYVGSANITWFELPDSLITKPTADSKTTSHQSDLSFTWGNDNSFWFTVTRVSTGDELFSTKGTKLVFEDQFIEFESSLPENYNLYGFGEVIHSFRMGNNFTRTFWAADVGDNPDANLYGDHPFYLDTRYYSVDDEGKCTYVADATAGGKYKSYSHGVYLRNSHGMEVLMRPTNITWRTLGGNIDLYFFAGPTQKKVISAFQNSAVGLPAMQQYFGFGYHQCRWGYKNWTQLQEVVDNMEKFGLPLDNIWTDIDYMNQYRDFDNDQNTFGYTEGAKFLEKLHAGGRHYIPIVDSAIYVPNPDNKSDAYNTFDRGKALNSFMLNPDGSLYIGEVWPGYTVFPDWIGAVLYGGGAFEWWTDEMTRWHKLIAFDGIWIDMSEVSSFCVGSCGSKNISMNPVHPPFGLPGEPDNMVYGYPEGFNITNATEYSSISSLSSASAASASAAAGPPATTSTTYLRTTPTAGAREINWPPYVINNIQGDLAVHAVSPNATHHGGTVEYDYHNLFGHQILNATYHALLNVFPGKRPFIIGRSTFSGSGKWAGHWGGDNTATFYFMAMSIPQALSFSLSGIPMFGVDTCGFGGNTDEELCNRWMQLSAFFTFYRNHNVLSAISQEPYQWASVIDATKIAAGIRYTLLPYIYTLFYQAHTTGSTVMRALAWEFPDDPSLANADRQFLLGGSLLITPVLNQGATSVDGVFPGVGEGEVWYDWYTQGAVSAKAGENVTIPAPLGHIPVYVRGGSVLPTQEPGLTTAASRKNPWGLLVALSSSGSATGELYVDDGESIKPESTLLVDFSASHGKLSAKPSGKYSDTNALATVTVMGVSSAPDAVTLNGKKLGGVWSYDAGNKVLAIKGLEKATAKGAWSAEWELKWS